MLEKDVKVEEKLDKAKEKFDGDFDASLPEEEPKQENIVVETPNYDLIKDLSPAKQKRVLKLTKQAEKEKAKKSPSPVKKICLALILGLTISLGIYSTVDLATTLSAYNAAQSQYSVNVFNLLKNIASVDSGNKAAELVETYPKQLQSPDALKKQSNWFDRFCNFLSGLFGG